MFSRAIGLYGFHICGQGCCTIDVTTAYSGEKQAKHRKSAYNILVTVLPCCGDRWHLVETAYCVSAHVQVQQIQEELSAAARSNSCSTSPLLHKQLAQLLQERDAILAHNHQLTGQSVTCTAHHTLCLLLSPAEIDR